MSAPEIPPAMIRAARREHWLRGRVRTDAVRVPIVCNGAVAGFFTPHRAAGGEMRMGPLYVSPEYRGRGLARAACAAIHGPMLAFIETGNVASECMHEAAGFVRVRPYALGWWWRRT